MAAPAAIEVQEVVKAFGAQRALDGVSLSVPFGALVAVVGPNGAGKSTLLRILSTTIRPDSGTARVDGCDVTRDAAAVRGRIGLCLGDERSWYWPLSGRRNLEFFGALQGLRAPALGDRIDLLLTEVGLTQSAGKSVASYSSGMRLRLALARALMHSPNVLLLDEPTRSLDPSAAASFRRLLRERVETRGCSVLETTHNMNEAASADAVVVLAAGAVHRRLAGEVDADSLEQELLRLEATA